MKYFSRKTSHYTPKNKLQKAVLDQMDRYAGYVIDSSVVFIDDLKRIVARENNDYPNCQALMVRSWTIGLDLFVEITVLNNFSTVICSLELHRIKGEFCPITAILQEGGSHV